MKKEVKNIVTKELSSDIVSCKITTQLKTDVEKVLNRLGLGYSEAIKIYFNQIVLTNSIPFNISIPINYVDKTQIKGVARYGKRAIPKKPIGTKTNQESSDIS